MSTNPLLEDGARARVLVVPALALLAAVTIGAFKLPYGVFWPDEGFYLSSSRRLLLGDQPFRDEISYATSWFFVALAPILALLPDGRTVLQVRVVGSTIRFVSAAAALWQRYLLDAMVRGGRIPRYAVRLMEGEPDEYVSPAYSSRPETDPINVFVVEHYRLEAVVPPFELFRHR